MRLYCLLISTGLLAYSYSVCANDSITTPAVVVTATAISEDVKTGEVDHELATGFSHTLKREQFENRVATLADTLTRETGIQVRQAGGFGSFSTVTLRGASSEQILIYLDGLLLNDAAGGGVDLGSISTSNIESIDVYRGSTPLSLGRSSIGGAINIKTLNAENTLTGNTSLSYGSFDTQKLSTFVSKKKDNKSYVVSAEYFSSKNNFDIINDNNTNQNPNDDRKEKRHNNQFEQYNLSTKMGYDINSDLSIDGVVQLFKKRQHIPSWNNHKNTNTHFDTRRQQAQLRLIANDLGSYSVNTSSVIEYLRIEEQYDDRLGNIGIGQQYTRNITSVIKGRYFAEIPLSTQFINIVAEASEETYRPKDLLGRTFSSNSKRHTYTLGVESKLFLLDDTLLLNPAISSTWTKDDLSSPSHEEDSLVTNKGNRHYISPRIGIKYFFNHWLTLKTNVGRYTREPTFYELLGDRGFFIGDFELTAESGTNYDIGVEVVFINPAPHIENIEWQTSYYHSDVDDIITRTYNARGVGKVENITEADITGLETSLRLNIAKKLHINFNADLQNPINVTKDSELHGKNLPNRFRQTYSARIDYEVKTVSPFFEYLYQKNMYYDSPNSRKATDKKLLNIGASWNRDPFDITLEITNITDETYEDYRGFPQPGRALFGTLKINF